MPTILLINGWRFFFYSNENDEPIHIHIQKGEKECKYWIDSKNYDLLEAYSYNMKLSDKREVKKYVFSNFELIENEWKEFQKRKKYGK